MESNNSLITQQGSVTANISKGEFDALSSKQKNDNKLLLNIMIAVVIFVVITFWIELSSMHRNYEQDKSLMLQNNELNKDYFDKVLLLNNEIQDIKTNLEVLKAKNSYLKQ
ncbi:MAG: hypothetical protein WC089_00905 [Candidatus Paceibacterota bacterium]